MMSRKTLPLALGLAALFSAPTNAEASILNDLVCTNPLNVCVQFGLSQGLTIDSYNFTVTYVSASGVTDPGLLAFDPGVLTAFGIYDRTGGTNFTFDNLSTTSGWSISCPAGLGGDGIGGSLFEACAQADPPPVVNGLMLGQSATLSFTSPNNFANAFYGELGVRAHIQSFGQTDCSLKVDPSSAGNTFSNDGCVPIEVVPEPISMALLGTGLAGLGVVRRRRRNGDIESE